MNKYIKIFHSTFEIDEVETRHYLVLTEACLLTNRVLRTYAARLPQWVAKEDNPDYEYYQLIFN